MRRSLIVFVVLSALVAGASLRSAGAVNTLSVGYVTAWGAEGLDPGQFTYPRDVTADKWGNVYVAGNDTDDHRVQMFTNEGDFIREVGTTGDPNPDPTILDRPASVTTDRWGNIWVAERGGESRVSRFFPELYNAVKAGSWTGSGPPPQDVSEPNGIAASLDGSIYTVLGGSYVQRWTSSGEYFTSWTTDGGTQAVAVAPDGDVYATNNKHQGSKPDHVMRFTWYGMPITEWGGSGVETGEFSNPYDLGVDSAGNVFVVDTEGHRVQVFTPGGVHLTTFGESGAGEGQLRYPYGIGIGLDRTVYVADTLNNRVSKWSVSTPATVAEIAGGNRFATAKAASEKAFPSPSESEYIVVATGRNWPDALGGAALAGVLKAPLLLTEPDTLSPQVTEEIDRLNVQEIYVLGGDGAVSSTVYSALAALVGPGDIKRLGGTDRYETANRIAEEVVAVRGSAYDGTAFVVTGYDFPDALAVSPMAAANGWPIFLTRPTALPASVKTKMQALGVTHGYIAGGTGVVSAAVASELDATFAGFTRYWGADRYETAAAIAEAGFDGMGMLWSRPALATGQDFPDALAGGVLQGSDYTVLLLTRGTSLPAATADALTRNAQSIYEIRFLGGTGAISSQVRASATALLP
jgi:putative cell wall-binding protein